MTKARVLFCIIFAYLAIISPFIIVMVGEKYKNYFRSENNKKINTSFTEEEVNLVKAYLEIKEENKNESDIP